MEDRLKVGRKTFLLLDGDTILDNGACYQFLTRKVKSGYYSYPRTVSKKAFNEFINMDNVKLVKEIGCLKYYKYIIE